MYTRIVKLLLLSVLFSSVALANNIVVIPLNTSSDSPVGKTGQTLSWAVGDDGSLAYGKSWPTPRFSDIGNGTIRDNFTGLIWLKKANCIATDVPEFDTDDTLYDGKVTWQHALDFIDALNSETYECGQAVGGASVSTDWRLPNVRELLSLVNFGQINPAVPDTNGSGQHTQGDPFTGLALVYWSSSSYAGNSTYAWHVGLNTGHARTEAKIFDYYVLPVRGGYQN